MSTQNFYISDMGHFLRGIIIIYLKLVVLPFLYITYLYSLYLTNLANAALTIYFILLFNLIDINTISLINEEEVCNFLITKYIPLSM